MKVSLILFVVYDFLSWLNVGVHCFTSPIVRSRRDSLTGIQFNKELDNFIVVDGKTVTVSKGSEEKEKKLPKDERKYWEIGETLLNQKPRALTVALEESLKTNTHPVETQDELGRGIFITKDWRKAYHTYQSPPDQPDLIDPETGYAKYIIDDIEGIVPDDLVGVLYRNGPGRFGWDGDRVQHVLDGDGLIIQVTFPDVSPDSTNNGNREFQFQSRFVETKEMVEERKANQFLYRGTFGTGPRGFAKAPKLGLNEDPWDEPILSKVFGNALKTDIKNSANTQIISFGGKLLALFEAGLPYRIDPETLQTVGEDTLDGVLTIGKLPVKISASTTEHPANLGGAAHTAHPNVCPDTGNLVGWHWSTLVQESALEVTFTEWDSKKFESIKSSTFVMNDCALAPHDMALTENCILLQVNAMEMNQAAFISGMKGPAASLKMNGRSPVQVHVFPRPTAKEQFEPYVVEVPPCFSIHVSHAYEMKEENKIKVFFSGWPPSDSKDFLGAWGGFVPVYSKIPITSIWKLEIDTVTKKCVGLGVAPGSANACAEHPLVHPNFNTKAAKNVYVVVSNLVGDSTAPCGYSRLRVEDSDDYFLPEGEKNEEIDSYFFGTRYFAGEPLIVPKKGGDPNDEDDAYLLGMVQDCVNDRAGVAIFDLQSPLRNGPLSILWLKSSIPHGLHGCFQVDKSNSVFC